MALAKPLTALALSLLALVSCENRPPAPEGTVRATIAGKTFFLETAIDDKTRTQGLSGRDQIPADAGMIFVFPFRQVQSFVMRDCLVPIDILYIADNQRIVNMHAMNIDPRRPNEPLMVYEQRLRKYTSEGPVRIAIELAGGSIERLGLAQGDLVDIDGLEQLKSAAR